MLLVHGPTVGSSPEFRVHLLTSSTLSDTEIKDRLLKLFKEYGISAEYRQISYLTEDGSRRRQTGIHRRTVSTPNFRKALSRLTRDVEIHTYQYNVRSGSKELKEPAIDFSRLPAWLHPLLGLAFDQLKDLFLGGRISQGTITSARKLIEMTTSWGDKATEEALGLLLSRSLGRIGRPQLDLKLKSLGVDTGELAMHGFINLVAWASTYKPTSGDADIAFWRSLAGAVLRKQWLGKFDCFSEIGRLCELPSVPDCPSSSKDISWLLSPERERILRYIQDSAVKLDEFLDLASLKPPPGYDVHRLLSNTSAWKVVYKAEDAEGNFVALKRYKDWNKDRMQQLLIKSGFTKEQVEKKDTRVHWLSRIRHTKILPCGTIRNEGGQLFIVEPLLETTLDRATIREPSELLRLMRDVCEAVTYIHSEGLIHRDIKPDNIGIEHGRAVLIDFGIATIYSHSLQEHPGSIKTRAPELFGKKAVITFKADVFALGATLMGLASRGEYPLTLARELKQLPPQGDTSRGIRRKAVMQRIEQRIEKYKKDPSLLKKRITQKIRPEFSIVFQPVLRACALDPNKRPNAKGLIKLIDEAIGAA